MEEEAEKLKQLQSEAEQQMNVGFGMSPSASKLRINSFLKNATNKSFPSVHQLEPCLWKKKWKLMPDQSMLGT
jgi:hypothetical protein